MKIRILPSALEDLQRGRDFYSSQGEGVGEYFLDALLADIDSLALYAGVHVKVFGYHRLLAKRFPYAIYYKCEVNVCTVWRVLDCRQNPSGTRQALV